MMNAYLRNQVAALFLLLPVTSAMVAFPTAAMAQPGALELRFLKISSDAGFNAGAQLGFTAEGTPGVQASLRIDGVNRDIALKETTRGIYTGSYTLQRQDGVSQSSALTLTLQDGERSAPFRYGFPPGMGNTPPTPNGPQSDTQPSARSPGTSTSTGTDTSDGLRMDRFIVAPITQIEPGAELRFSVSGQRGASASVQIPGLAERVPLREVRSGVYEGGYTIRKQDKLNPSQPIVATLAQGRRTAKSRQVKAWVTNTRSPVRQYPPCEPLPAKTSRPSKLLAAKAGAAKVVRTSTRVAARPGASKATKSSSRVAAKSPAKGGAKASSRTAGKSTGTKAART